MMSFSARTLTFTLVFALASGVNAVPMPSLVGRAEFTKQNGLDAQKQNAQFASIKSTDACDATTMPMACVEGGFAQCVSGKWEVQPCAGGLQCFALPLVNKAGTSPSCDTEADALARIQATGVTGGIDGSGDSSSGSSTDSGADSVSASATASATDAAGTDTIAATSAVASATDAAGTDTAVASATDAAGTDTAVATATDAAGTDSSSALATATATDATETADASSTEAASTATAAAGGDVGSSAGAAAPFSVITQIPNTVAAASATQSA